MSDVGGIAADRLKSFIERIEQLEEEKAESRATSRMSMPKPRAPASTPRSSARSSACGRWSRTTAASRKSCWISTSRPSACWSKRPPWSPAGRSDGSCGSKPPADPRVPGRTATGRVFGDQRRSGGPPLLSPERADAGRDRRPDRRGGGRAGAGRLRRSSRSSARPTARWSAALGCRARAQRCRGSSGRDRLDPRPRLLAPGLRHRDRPGPASTPPGPGSARRR